MYIKIIDNKPIKYSIEQLRKDNPQVSFPSDIPDNLLAAYNVYAVKPTQRPPTDSVSYVVEKDPEFINNEWVQAWELKFKDQSVIDAENEQLRIEAYRNESDPLFFKYQRGEIDKEVWLDKVAEIKERYS